MVTYALTALIGIFCLLALVFGALLAIRLSTGATRSETSPLEVLERVDFLERRLEDIADKYEVTLKRNRTRVSRLKRQLEDEGLDEDEAAPEAPEAVQQPVLPFGRPSKAQLADMYRRNRGLA